MESERVRIARVVGGTASNSVLFTAAICDLINSDDVEKRELGCNLLSIHGNLCQLRGTDGLFRYIREDILPNPIYAAFFLQAPFAEMVFKFAGELDECDGNFYDLCIHVAARGVDVVHFRSV